ncbi:MAG: hypothetical protein JXA54_06530 [Candidatus Heimdallarchaeota archaeon]|nr:hypothetical protein [Candidatus Heimdallarchaeota archaeon]
MSSTYYRKKSFPISLALGITQTLHNTELVIENFLSPLSFEDQKIFLFHTKNLAISCFNPHPKERKPNPALLSLAVRRVLALKSHTPFPVIIVVKTSEEGKLFAEKLEGSNSGGKLFNMIYALKNKFSKNFLTSTYTDADFILLTYHKLRELVFKKACPSTDQIVFINPLTKHHYIEEAIFLDDIIAGLHRHKCRKPYFTFLFDSALFPTLTRDEYQSLLDVEECLYFRCEEPSRGLLDNPLRFRSPYLTDEQIQIFILRELFRGRKSFKELIERFKSTITYHIYLYNNNLYPSLISPKNQPLNKDLILFKKSLEKKICLKISLMLNLFHKGQTKTIIGRSSFADDSSDQKNFSWSEPVETAPFLQLVEKKQDRNYYLTALGEAVLFSTTHIEGVQRSFSQFLHDLAHTLYKNKNPSAKLSLEDILSFFCLLVGMDAIELPEQLQAGIKNGSQYSKASFYEHLDCFIEQNFSFRIASYEGMASLQLLSAFEELMDDQAFQFIQQLKDYKKEKKKFSKEQLREEIIQLAQYTILTEKSLCQKYKLESKEIKKILEGLVTEELLVSLNTTECCGRTVVIYCSDELLEKNPQLKKFCGDCLFYARRFKTCPLLRLVAMNAPSVMPSDCWKYIFEPIEKYTTGCVFIQEKELYTSFGNSLRFTITKEQLAQRMQHLPIDFFLGQTPQTTYHCLTCQTIIEVFGTSQEPYFPQKRICCPNCATTYLLRSDQSVVVQIEYRHFLRMKYYQLTGSIPEILEEKDSSDSIIIYDTEGVTIMEELGVDYLIFAITNRKVPLTKIQHLFFAGRKYQELEEQLLSLIKKEPEKYHYTISRAVIEKEQEESLTTQPYSSKDYHFLQNLIAYLHRQKVFNIPLAITRHLSNIAGLLHLRKISLECDDSVKRINRQLYEMVDLLLRVQTSIKTSTYGRQLEALSNNFFFEFLKDEGLKVGLWSYGRVNSRLVKDMLLSFSNKLTNAYAPFDALLNQLVKVFRSKIDLLFQRIGLSPAKLGPGFYHRRKTKSAIDKLGFYFDLIECVRVLVLVTFYDAMRKGLLTEKDCKYVLGSNNQEIFRVRFSSLAKINQLVDEALASPVQYDGQILPFLQAFEHYIQAFKQAIDNCKSSYLEGNHLSTETIMKLFKEAHFQPFIFCSEECVIELALVNKFTKKFATYYDGIEQLIMRNKANRESSRVKLLEKWCVCDKSKNDLNISLTKHQQNEQERSLLVALFLLYQGLQNNLFFGNYPTIDFQTILGLNQNQVQRVLIQMVERELLIKKKYKRTCYYQLNYENKAIHELLFSIGLVDCQDEKQKELLKMNSSNILSRVAMLIEKYIDIALTPQSQSCWSNWKPTTSFKQILDWFTTQLKICEQIISSGE